MKQIKTLLGLIALSLALTPVALNAESSLSIPKPVQGKQCVEPTDDMRRNHMKYLLFHRDATMREGIRTKQHSLKECIICHVPPQNQAQASSTGSEEHFCKNCHEFAAVKLDCFECHATHPEKSMAK